MCHGGIGDDAVVRIVSDSLAVVENVDVFTPIHDDPFVQGQIVACNATNDIFAMGVTDVLSLQAFLALPKDLPEEISVGVLRGMSAFVSDLGAEVTGGQTITNPCPVFGGICLGIAQPEEIVYSSGARPGDVVLLTKPLGIQPAMRSYRDLKDPEKRSPLLERFSEKDLLRMQDIAVRVMTGSNLQVAKVMRAVGVDAATDITGFGLLGHANNVAVLSGVDIVIDAMPVIAGTLELASFYGHRLASGHGAETAGGMLVCVPADRAEQFTKQLGTEGLPCWTVGRVLASDSPRAYLAEGVQYIETEFP